MPLQTGARLGPYEISRAARRRAAWARSIARGITRLGRDVALKILPSSFSSDPDRLRRFEQEAKAAGLLNHPNITAIYDVGTHEGSPYIVSELLEGETLRSRLAAGPLSSRRATELGAPGGSRPRRRARQGDRPPRPEAREHLRHQGRPGEDPRLRPRQADPPRAHGLRRHRAGRRARDVRVHVARAGSRPPGRRALRRLRHSARSSTRCSPGQRAFHGNSAASTMSAILMREPPELSTTNRQIHPGLERIVRHCLEKNPEERFHSAHDLAFDLEALTGVSAPATTAIDYGRARRWKRPLAAAGLVLAGAVAAPAPRASVPRSRTRPSYERMSRTRLGGAFSARFAPGRAHGGLFRVARGAPYRVSSSRSGHRTGGPRPSGRRPRSRSPRSERWPSPSDAASPGGTPERSPACLSPAARRAPSSSRRRPADWSADGSALAVVAPGAGQVPDRVPRREDHLRDGGRDPYLRLSRGRRLRLRGSRTPPTATAST